MKPSVVIDIKATPGVKVAVNFQSVDDPVDDPVDPPVFPLVKLQQIVDDASPGSIVTLKPATYVVSPNVPLQIKRGVTLRAEINRTVILERTEKEDESQDYANKCLVYTDADSVTLDGIVLRGPGTASRSYAGWVVTGSYNTFVSGTVEGIYHTGLGYGILVDRGSVGFTLVDSTLQRCRHGIDMTGNKTQAVIGTRILRNQFLDMEDDLLGNHQGARDTEIIANYIEDGPLSVGKTAGMTLQGTEGLILRDNTIKNTGALNIGIFIQFIPGGKEKGITGVEISGNKIIGAAVVDGIQLDGRAVRELPDLPLHVVIGQGNTVEAFTHSGLYYKRNSGNERYVDKNHHIASGLLTAPPTRFTE